MMRWIVGSSLRFRRLILAAAVGVLGVGVFQASRAPVGVLPEFSPPTVEVQTEALGLSAEEVEQLITVPLEQDLLVGVPFLAEIESVSLPGLSSVVMTFEEGTDLLDARQVVQERLTQAVGVAGLPEVAKPPQMIQPLSSQSRLSMIRLSSEELTPIEVSVLARWVIGPRLMGVPGVANVAFWGNRDRQLQVLVDPERLRQHGVTLSQVIATSGNALEVSPLSFLEASSPGTGGFIDTLNQRLNIFHEQAITTADELAQVPLETPDDAAPVGGSTPVTLGDVTDVVEDHQPLIGDAVCAGGQDCLLLVVEKFPAANTVEVTEGVEDALEALAPGLADMQIDSSIYRPASFIQSSLTDTFWALVVGGLLLLLVIIGLFWEWRRAVVTVAAVAVSLGAAALVLSLSGTTVNLLIVAGLILGSTAVVHDVVGDVHDLSRRLRTTPESAVPAQRRTGPVDSGAVASADGQYSGGRAWRGVVAACAANRTAALYAVLIVAAASLPLFLVRGEGGAFLPPIAVAYFLVVLASMVVALTVTPVLALMLLSGDGSAREESPALAWAAREYRRLVSRTLTRPGVVLIACAVVAGLGLVAVPFLDASMRPALKEEQVLVHVEAAPGTSLPRMVEVTEQAVSELGALPGVTNVGAHVGRAVASDEVVDVNSGEIWVTVDDDAEYDATLSAIRRTVQGHPEMSTEVLTYSSERVTDVLGGDGDDVVVRLYGEDGAVLDEKAEQVRSLLDDVDGVTSVTVVRAPQEPVMEVEVDLARAQKFGIKPGDARRAAATLLGGITVGNLFQEQKVFDVVVWGDPSVRQSEADVQQLLIDTPGGGHVQLGQVAEVRNVLNPTVIRHESVSSYLDVVVDVSGRSAGDVAAQVDSLVAGIEFPLEHHAEILGDYADRQAATTGLAVSGVAALFAVLLLLQAAFRSWRLAVLSLLLLPLALVGGLAGVLVTGGTVSLGSVAGLGAVLGIAARGLIVSVRHYQDVERRQGVAFGRDLVLMGSRDNLPTVVGPALAAAAVLAPIAVIGAGPGLEILHPMAVVVLTGLVTATVVILLVLPAMYLRFGFQPEPETWVDELAEPVSELDPVHG